MGNDFWTAGLCATAWNLGRMGIMNIYGLTFLLHFHTRDKKTNEKEVLHKLGAKQNCSEWEQE